MSNYVGDALQLLIEKLLYGGDGLAHHGTRVCFVKDVIPGEKVTARVDKVKSQYLLTSLVEILTPSLNRINPVCPYFNLCGGCQWQHIEYTHQLHWKAQILKECLARIGNIQDPTVLPPIPSPSVFNYRYRTSLKVRITKEPVIGYFKRESHDIIPVTHCALLTAPLNNALEKCWELLQSEPDFFKDILELNMLFVNQSNQVIISFKNRKNKTKSRFLFQNGLKKFLTHKDIDNEEIMGISFKRDTESFYQINYRQNLLMINLVLRYFSPVKNKKILDLYCGCGNFSLFLAREGAGVTGIDSNSFAVTEAVYNANLNNMKNCNFIKADLDRTTCSLPHDTFQAVLLNPPRSGCSNKILKQIAGINPDTVVYVSCNPSTLVRDVRKLINSGYTIEEIQPLDMFPQTYHIETVVKLTRR
jgi:23S rRNA (uracil1939-C5)-methyltransferase